MSPLKLRQDPLGAILVIFGRSFYIFFLFERSSKIWKMIPLLRMHSNDHIHRETQNVGAPAWTHTEPLLREMKLCSIDVRFKLKLLIHTYRCTHALASSLLCQQYKLGSHSNSTHSTTRSQLTLSLCIPSAARRPGTISPLFTSTLLWNSLPSPIRSASSLHTFRQELQKYLGIPVIRPR